MLIPIIPNARRCPKQPIKPGRGGRGTWLRRSRGKHKPKRNAQNTHSLRVPDTTSLLPHFKKKKSHNRFPFSSNSELPEGERKKKKKKSSPWFILILIYSVKGKQKEFSETAASLEGKLGQTEPLWHGLVHWWVRSTPLAPPFTRKNTNLKAHEVRPDEQDTRQRQPRWGHVPWRLYRLREMVKLRNRESEVELIRR